VFPQPGIDDIESFIRTFERQLDGDYGDGIVSPGSYIQFFVSPILGPNDCLEIGENNSRLSGGIILGTTDDVADTPSSGEISTALVQRFGAVSSNGMYLKSNPIIGEDIKDPSAQILSKVDVPNSYIICNPKV
jgi:hypothetical protein